MYANVRHPDGRESTVSVRDLARPEMAPLLGEEVNKHHVATCSLDSPTTPDVKIVKIVSDATDP